METKIPTNLSESMTEIIKLQAITEWLQGQNDLLLGFITSEPDSRKSFAHFLQLVAESKEESLKDSAVMARTMLKPLAGNLSSPQQQPSPTSPDKPSPESNVIQFPKFPKDD